MEEFQSAVYRGNLLDAILSVEEEPLQYFNSTPLHIAVVGEPGSGKSSFVNSMLGLHSGEPGAAETGIQTTTVKAKEYPHPVLPQVILWDLPGKEDSSFGVQIEPVDLNRYDFFIIVGYQRFRTVHADLAHEIREMGKRFFFVRAKIDLDLEASRRRQPAGCDEEKVLQRIRKDCVMSLQAEGVSDPQVFLMSNWDPKGFDFPLLLEKLQSDLLWLKKQAFMFRLPSRSVPILEKKKTTLEKNLWLKSFCLGLFALLPLPGLSFISAMLVFRWFRSRCYQSFGLDDRSLAALANEVGKPVSVLQAVMTSRALRPVILRRLPDLAGAILMIVEYSVWHRYPICGSLLSGGISFFASYYMLWRCISTVANDTQKVLTEALKLKEKKSV